MIHTAPLDTDQIAEHEIITDTETYLEEHGYPTSTGDCYLAVNAKAEDDNSGYLVKELTTTRVPLLDADVVADEIQIYVCTCAAYRYKSGVDDLGKSDSLSWTPCKHIESVDKALRASNDENQATL